MKIAIIGSRPPPEDAPDWVWGDYESLSWLCKEYVARLAKRIAKGEQVTVVSGYAPGIDSVAEREAKRLGIPFHGFRADWSKYGKRAGPERNARMERGSDRVAAFWNLRSRGTLDCFGRFYCAGKDVEVFGPSGFLPEEAWVGRI